MTVADSTQHEEHGHTGHVEHPPQYAPAFLALSSILVAFAVNFVSVTEDQHLFGLITLPKDTAVAFGFALAGIYAVFLLIFFIKEALNKKIVPTLSEVVYSKNLFIWLFIASEIIFFGVIIGLSLILRINTQIAGQPWINAGLPAGSEHYYEVLTGASSIIPTVFITFVLLLSSVTMMKAVEAMERSDRTGLRNWLFLTVLGGVIFLVVKIFEYSTLFSEGILVNTNTFWTTFFLTTGFHTLHVTVGVMILIGFLVKAAMVKGETAFNAENGQPVEIMAIYWHYVDCVWIFLMPLIYLLT
jgi:heme/copper-type cytochrome/quinol oxidase subunit 3